MEIAFQTKSLRDLCESRDKLRRQFGDHMGENITTRLADLRAASTIHDVVIGNPREVTRDGRPTMTLDLQDGHVIVFCANHLKMPLHPDSSIDWTAVSRIKILGIEGNNG
jgi:hypothetical protein